MTSPKTAVDLIGRQGAVTRLAEAGSGVVTGWVGAGTTAVLAAVVAGRQFDEALVTFADGDVVRRGEPLSYLGGLRLRPGPGRGHDIAPGALLTTARSPDAVLTAVEVTADLLRRVAAGRRIALVLDDLHHADEQSLALLPWLARRTGATVLAGARVPAPGRHPRPAVRQALARLDLAARVHLPRLSAEELRAVVRNHTGRTPTGPALARVEQRLGTAHGNPGLVLATWPAAALWKGHPLVREMRARPRDAVLVALAGTRSGLTLRDLDGVAATLGSTGDAVADAVDRLTDDGWLSHEAGHWAADIPVLADALRGDVPAPLRRVLGGRPPAARRPVSPVPSGARPVPARSDRVTQQVASMLRLGLGNAQIAAGLGLSEKTVEGYVTRLLGRYRCTNRTQLTARLLGVADEPGAPA